MFVGKDVAFALGYSNTRDALTKHVDTEDKGTVAIRDTAYETRVTIINESGVMEAIQNMERLRKQMPHFCFISPSLLTTLG